MTAPEPEKIEVSYARRSERRPRPRWPTVLAFGTSGMAWVYFLGIVFSPQDGEGQFLMLAALGAIGVPPCLLAGLLALIVSVRTVRSWAFVSVLASASTLYFWKVLTVGVTFSCGSIHF